MIFAKNSLVVQSTDFEVLTDPAQYKQQLLSLIENARQRIYITALYLQDDEAGREVLHALYQAKANTPTLEINVFVDYHRGKRGLIGEKESLGNRAIYLELAENIHNKLPFTVLRLSEKNCLVFCI